jgi:NAD+ synthase (glutamine-hydrolysing)
MFGCAYIFANLLGNEAGRVIYDGHRLVSSGGRIVAEGERLTFDDCAITEAVIDIDENRTRRVQNHSFKMADDLHAPRMFGEPHLEKVPNIDHGRPDKSTDYEEFTNAVSLGLWDYMRKSHSNGFILSLSGGVDSTACAVLVREMIERAVGNKEPLVVKDMMTCVYQATKNSSDDTKDAARSVAEGLGFKFEVWEIDKLVEGYSNLVESSIVRKLDWNTDDMALQNIQARVRAPGIWMLANINNALLLTTSNRSEAAVGYATMDGDTCGGLAPIAGIGKPFLIDWLQFMSNKYPCLEAVLKLKPSAELRPEEQSDEADLMPYPLLEEIQKAAIRDKLSPSEVFERLVGEGRHYKCTGGPDELQKHIDKFFTLWHRNQWKRERYAPAFHVDDESLDPKTWCRFPILSGRL